MIRCHFYWRGSQSGPQALAVPGPEGTGQTPGCGNPVGTCRWPPNHGCRHIGDKKREHAPSRHQGRRSTAQSPEEHCGPQQSQSSMADPTGAGQLSGSHRTWTGAARPAALAPRRCAGAAGGRQGRALGPLRGLCPAGVSADSAPCRHHGRLAPPRARMCHLAAGTGQGLPADRPWLPGARPQAGPSSERGPACPAARRRRRGADPGVRALQPGRRGADVPGRGAAAHSRQPDARCAHP